MDTRIASLAVFLACYLLFVLLPGRRSLTAISGALLLLVTGAIGPMQAVAAVNWNVMGIFVGTLVIADVFMQSRVPAYLAEIIVDRAKNTAWAILFICLLTGVISAFVENVATVLIVAPIALSLAKKLGMNPIKMMIAIAISSNLQGAATLIGDPPSMLLAGYAKMNFSDFFLYKGRPGIFFAVELGALASFVVLYFIFRRHKEKAPLVPVERVRSWVPTGLLAGLVAALALSSFLDPGFGYLAGAICMAFGIASIIWDRIANRSSMIRSIRTLDWDTTFFLMGIFVLVGGIASAGWIDAAAELLSGIIGTNILFGYVLMVSVAVAISAFVDNVPFLAAMLPVAITMSARLGIGPELFLFGLLIGASLGGNITPIGASANIVACGLLRKEGHVVRFRDFAGVGIPFTLAATAAGALFVWLVWGV